MMKKILLFCALVFLSHSQASELEKYKEIVASNLAEIQAFNHMHWRMNRVSNNGELILHEAFDPGRSQHWQLIQINGQQPDSQQLKTYLKKQNVPKDKQNKSANLEHLIILDSLKVISQQGDQVTLSFAPQISDFSKQDQKKLTGSLLIDTQQRLLRTLNVHNTDKINPAFSVSFQQFMVNLEFAYQAQQIVLVEQQSYIPVASEI